MGYRPLRFSRITNKFAAPGSYASRSDDHGPAGHHTGIDFGKSLSPYKEIDGKLVRSSTSGFVVISEYNSTMGNWVGVWNRKDDVLITYWHLSERYAKNGEFVQRGQALGRVGSTGNSTAPHLHVQANRGGRFDYHGHIDPSPWVRGKIWAGTHWRKRRKK